MKRKIILATLCNLMIMQVNAAEESVPGYGAYQFSSRFHACIVKELSHQTRAEQELTCLQEELQDLKAELDGTYQELVVLMRKNHWKKRLKTLQTAQKDFERSLTQLTQSTEDLYGSRMAGFSRFYEALDFLDLRRKHLKHLLEYYRGQ